MNAQIALLAVQEAHPRRVAREPLRLTPARRPADRDDRERGAGLRSILARLGGRTVDNPPVAP